MNLHRNPIPVLALIAIVSVGLAVAAWPKKNDIDGVCFKLPDGTNLHLKFPKPVDRDDALAVNAEVLRVTKEHRDKVMRGEAKGNGFEDRMVLQATLDQFGGGAGEGGLHCVMGMTRMGPRVAWCDCEAAGTGCIRITAQ